MLRNLNWGLSLVLAVAIVGVFVFNTPRPNAQDLSDSVSARHEKQSVEDHSPIHGDNENLPSRSSETKRVAKTAENRPQVDVPPPPLGIVPVQSKSLNDPSESPANPHDSFTIPVKHTVQSGRASRGSDDSELESAEQLPPASRVNPGRFSRTPPTLGSPPVPIARRVPSTLPSKREPTEQELQAQKLIHDRAANLAKQRQARLAARRMGNAHRYGVRGVSQMVQNPVKPSTTGGATVARTAKSL